MDLSFKNTAILVIDIQVDFCSPKGGAAKRGKKITLCQKMPEKINQFLEKVKDCNLPIIFTKFISGEKVTPKNLQAVIKKKKYDLYCKKASGGENFYKIKVPKNAYILEKPHFDAFAYTNLSQILKKHNIENLLICGVRTEICVDVAAKRAACEGYHSIIITDLTATLDDRKELHNSVLKFFDSYYGHVMTSLEIIKRLNDYHPKK